jgi:hypothetical protein
MRSRIFITVAALITYLVLFNLYIFNLTRTDITTSKLFYNYLTAGMTVFYVADWKCGFVNKYHEHFNFICILCVIVNYIIIILTHHTVIHNDKPQQLFWAFNGGVFAVTVLIVINFLKHGYHRN